MTPRPRAQAFFALFLFCLLFSASRAFALGGFNAVYSRDGTDVWAVGPGGGVYRSLDAGRTWSTIALGSTAYHDVTARNFSVWIVGDLGTVQRSANGGNSWAQVSVGSASLYAVQMVSDSVGYAVGSGGAIVKTVNGGASWNAQASGVGTALNAVVFTDMTHGWAAGAGGVLLATTNGGTSWTPVATGTTKEFLAIDAGGSAVWAVGREALAFRSLNGGGSWAPVDLKIDSRADVAGVDVSPSGAATLTGGGGFIRVTLDGGLTWTFRKHTFQGPVSDICLTGLSGFIVNSANHAVLITTDGFNWAVPPDVPVNRSWIHPLSYLGGGIRGSTIHQHGTHVNTLYGVVGQNVMKSETRGDNWSVIGTIPSVTKTNAYYVSPLDSMLMVAAVNNPDRIVRSINGGVSWVTKFTKDFSEYGVPLEMNVNNPNELFFGPEDGRLYRSLDFGATWDSLSYPHFRSPCDIQVMPDSSNVIWVGDGVTNTDHGQVFRSTNGGLTFTLAWTAIGSEIPMIAGSRLNRAQGFATSWPTGGVRRTLNYGASWDSIAGTISAWGLAVSDDDPNVVTYGVSGGGTQYLSFDGGTTFTTVPLTNFNYSLSVLDRNTMIAEQGNGFYKLNVTYPEPPAAAPPDVVVMSPNGGESIAAGANVSIRWNATSVPIARIQYRKAPGQPWVDVARVPGYQEVYPWVAPSVPTTTAKVRVFDDVNGTPADSSDLVFSIVAPSTGVPETPAGNGFVLEANRPNPFTRSTRISWNLPAASRVTLQVFTVEGRRVATLVDGVQSAGEHTIDFGEDSPAADSPKVGRLKSGVYFARLTAGTLSQTIRMLLVR